MWRVKLSLSVTPAPSEVEEVSNLTAFFTSAYEQFRKNDVIDPEMLSVAGEGTVTFSCWVSTDEPTNAMVVASAAVRTAISAAS